jgi:hypothetical protein
MVELPVTKTKQKKSLPVDLLMDQIILTCAAIIDFPGAKHFKYTSLV